ncbi:hypothetical protein [Nonomuraea sp. NPDC023979]|uniref:hypothetical protein n=1 Tax=Nonomuraea sp. NPDC023979 TaxID=3154796 RepID=UPI00340256D4
MIATARPGAEAAIGTGLTDATIEIVHYSCDLPARAHLLIPEGVNAAFTVTCF